MTPADAPPGGGGHNGGGHDGGGHGGGGHGGGGHGGGGHGAGFMEGELYPGESDPQAHLDAINAAMLATAFAAACAPGKQTISFDQLPATLRRAGVPGADSALPEVTDLTGHVALHFAEVHTIARKLRTQAAATPHAAAPAAAPAVGGPSSLGASCASLYASSTIGAAAFGAAARPEEQHGRGRGTPASALAAAGFHSLHGAPPPPVSTELRLRLARAFALECADGTASLPARSLRRALGAAGLSISPDALAAVLGGSPHRGPAPAEVAERPAQSHRRGRAPSAPSADGHAHQLLPVLPKIHRAPMPDLRSKLRLAAPVSMRWCKA